MAEEPTAFVFPAFISDYREDPSRILPAFGPVYRTFLNRASFIAGPGLLAFDPETNPMLQDELMNQYLSYIYSCSSIDIIRSRGLQPSMVAGYSMGIYAALYAAGSITFETGLTFIGKAYESIKKNLPSDHFGMCGVIGLNESDIKTLIREYRLALYVVNQNSEYSFILSGDSFHINVFIQKAREEGALHARSLGVTVPYHTHLLAEAAKELEIFVMSADVRLPEIPVISVLTQGLLGDAGLIRNEIARNLHQPFNWFATQQEMYLRGIHRFTECGPSAALQKNSRFMKGSGKFVSWASLLSE